MEFVESLLRDVTPGVGLLIVIGYVGRRLINVFEEMLKSNREHNRQLFELLTDLKTSYNSLESAIDRQTLIVSQKLEPVKNINKIVTEASEQITQDK